MKLKKKFDKKTKKLKIETKQIKIINLNPLIQYHIISEPPYYSKNSVILTKKSCTNFCSEVFVHYIK